MAGRKPLFSIEDLRKGVKIKLSVKQAKFGYQYAYALRKKNKDIYILFDPETRELFKTQL